MIDLLLLTACVGLVFIIAYSSILKQPREYLKLLKGATFFNELLLCSQCLGFWCGIFVTLIYFLLTEPISILLFYKSFLWGLSVSLIAPIIDMFMDVLGAYQEKMLDETEEIHNKKNNGNRNIK